MPHISILEAIYFQKALGLFIGKKVMAIIYVDDILFWSVDVNDIHEKEMKLREQGVAQSLLEVYDFQDGIMWHGTVQDGSVPLHW